MLRSFFLCIAFGCVTFLHSRADTTDSTFHPKVKPSLAITRRSGPIVIDGALDDEGWKNATEASGFTCALPVPMAKPPVATRAKITYDDEYLYVAMIADDPDPNNICASLVARDNVSDNDFMGIILDTYGDGSRAFEIYANPLGIQEDLFWSGNSEDLSYDLVYESEASITKTGWQLEMKIPFRSLRFPDDKEQHFRLTFWRNYPREAVYKMSWAAINFYLPCPFCQFGSLTGVEDIKPAASFELLPTLVVSQDATRNNESGKLDNQNIAASPSLGARYALGNATALELAVNPDFSQVESDATQISANTTFALFYPEHRPFFQDGSDLYNTYIPGIYTRSINSPLVAAKAIYRDNQTSIAYIGAYDEHTPELIPLEEKTIVLPDVGKSMSNIVRALHSFSDNRSVGALVTVRNYQDGGLGTLIGLDAHAQIIENIETSAQVLYSYTQEQRSASNGSLDMFDNNRYSVESNGEHYGGIATYFVLQRFTPGLDIQFVQTYATPTFRAANGFITNNDLNSFASFTGYKYIIPDPPHALKWFIEIDGSVSSNIQFNELGIRKLLSYKPELDFSFAGQTSLHLYYLPSTERFHDILFSGLYKYDANGSTHPSDWITLSWDVSSGRNIVRFLGIPIPGKQSDIALAARLKLFAGLLLEPNYAFEQVNSKNNDSLLIKGAIYRVAATYQFSRTLSVRVITQYDGFAKTLEVDPLLTLQFNPFTSLYVGSSHEYATFDSAMTTLQPSERHFFAKLQYLIQG